MKKQLSSMQKLTPRSRWMRFDTLNALPFVFAKATPDTLRAADVSGLGPQGIREECPVASERGRAEGRGAQAEWKTTEDGHCITLKNRREIA